MPSTNEERSSSQGLTWHTDDQTVRDVAMFSSGARRVAGVHRLQLDQGWTQSTAGPTTPKEPRGRATAAHESTLSLRPQRRQTSPLANSKLLDRMAM